MGSPSIDAAKRSDSRFDPCAWASALSGIEELPEQDPASASEALTAWWSQLDIGLLASLQAPPPPFCTLSFGNDAASVTSRIGLLQPVLRDLSERTVTLQEAMIHVAGQFGDLARLRAWRQLLQGFLELSAWLPHFQQEWEYVRAAFPGAHALEELRSGLLSTADDGKLFLIGQERSDFDRRFLEFRNAYAAYYCSLHDERRCSLTARREGGIDVTGLRNLELLSQLPYTDKSYINRVRQLAQWARPEPCSLPVRQILQQQPRCYCNFNPVTPDRTAEAARQMNGEIRDGIEYFRTLLCGCRQMILEELKDRRVQESTSRQIALLLSGGAAVELTPQAIEALKRIFRRHPEPLLQQIRA
jgi:hypothetical protein